MASITAVLAVVIAADLIVHRQQKAELQTIARAPTPTPAAGRISERPTNAKDQSEPSTKQAASQAESRLRSPNVAPRPAAPGRYTPAANAPPPPPQAAQAVQPEIGPLPTVDQPAKPAERAVSAASETMPVTVAVPSFIWPAHGRVLAGFGPLAGRSRNDGINIAVPEGTDVQAADDGVVVYAGSDVNGYGNLVLLRHSNGFVTAYAHASELLVSLGETVRRGQVIAKSGRSGNVSEPLVHFEIRKGTLPIDPMQYLPPG